MSLVAQTPGGSAQFFSGAISPDSSFALFAANQNNLAPENIGNISQLVLLPQAAGLSITGIATGKPDRQIIVANRTAFTVTLVNQSGLSLSANRFDFGGDIELAPSGLLFLVYNPLTGFWNALAGVGTGGGGGGASLGANVFTGLQTMPGINLTGYEQWSDAAVITPDPLAAGTTDDYAPPGVGTARLMELTPDVANSALSGIIAPDFGQVLTLLNLGAGELTLLSANVGSAAPNQFQLVADVTLIAYTSITLFYSLTLEKWVSVS